jgi:hypothetical protein
VARQTITENNAPDGGGNPTYGILNVPGVVQQLIDMVNEYAAALDYLGVPVSGGSSPTDSHAATYTATGSEGAVFTLAFSSLSPTFTTKDTTYTATGAVFGTTDLYTVECVASTRTTTSVQVVCSRAPAAGDKLVFVFGKNQ